MLFKSLWGKYRLPSILLTFVVGVVLIYVGGVCADLLPRVGLFILLFGVVFLLIGGWILLFYLTGIGIELLVPLYVIVKPMIELIDDWWKKVIWSREDSALALLREGKVSKKAVRVLVKVLTDKKPRPRFGVSRKDAAEALATTGWQPKRHLESLHYFATQKNWGKLIEAGNSAIPVLLLIIEECRGSVKGFSFSDAWGPTSGIKEELIEATKILLNIGDPRSVSYTHLTLPTKRIV